MEAQLSGIVDTTEKLDILVKENSKSENFQTKNIQEIYDFMKRPNLTIEGMGEDESKL